MCERAEMRREAMDDLTAVQASLFDQQGAVF